MGDRADQAGTWWNWGMAGSPLPPAVTETHISVVAFIGDRAYKLLKPVTNPFLFEDPRALTEIRPIFMWQKTPSSLGSSTMKDMVRSA